MSTELPQGWIETHDDDGNLYYYNEETGETSWEPPGVSETEAKEGSSWSKLIDDETGVPYYYDSVSGETSWDAPPGFLEDEVKDQSPVSPGKESAQHYIQKALSSPKAKRLKASDGLKTDWIEVWDEENNAPYFFNEGTQEVTWERPIAPQKPKEDEKNVAETETEDTLSWLPNDDEKEGDILGDGDQGECSSWSKRARMRFCSALILT